jgi:hypothetical protein
MSYGYTMSPPMIITSRPRTAVSSNASIKITAKLAVADPTGSYVIHADALDAEGRSIQGVLNGQLAVSSIPENGGNAAETAVFKFEQMSISEPGSYQIRLQAYKQLSSGLNYLTQTTVAVQIV